jgi:ferric-dicitrate binding protein FerR (iron transport regulator)
MNTPLVAPPVEDEHDPRLLAAYRELDAVSPSPGMHPRAVILAAAQRQAAFHARRSLWQRPGFLVGLAVVAAAAAAAVALQVMRKPSTTAAPALPVAAAPVAVAQPVAEPAANGETGAPANPAANP